jgi:hypothetical protein
MNIKINGRLDEHATELAATKDSYLFILIDHNLTT